MVNGIQIIRTVPGSALVRVERQLKRQLTEEEEILECQKVRLQLKRELEGGTE